MGKALILAGVLLASSSAEIVLAAGAGHGVSITCEKADGMIRGPYVANETAARGIFKTIAAAIEPRALRNKGYPIVVVVDDGKSWAVYEQQRGAGTKVTPLPNGRERVIVTAGGGGLILEIDKCTGAITQAYYDR